MAKNTLARREFLKVGGQLLGAILMQSLPAEARKERKKRVAVRQISQGSLVLHPFQEDDFSYLCILGELSNYPLLDPEARPLDCPRRQSDLDILLQDRLIIPQDACRTGIVDFIQQFPDQRSVLFSFQDPYQEGDLKQRIGHFYLEKIFSNKVHVVGVNALRYDYQRLNEESAAITPRLFLLSDSSYPHDFLMAHTSIQQIYNYLVTGFKSKNPCPVPYPFRVLVTADGEIVHYSSERDTPYGFDPRVPIRKSETFSELLHVVEQVVTYQRYKKRGLIERVVF